MPNARFASLAALLLLAACGGTTTGASGQVAAHASGATTSDPTAASTTAPTGAPGASAPGLPSASLEACVTATVAAANACEPEREDPGLLVQARLACEAAERDGSLASLTTCSLHAADDTHEACQRELEQCLAAERAKRGAGR